MQKIYRLFFCLLAVCFAYGAKAQTILGDQQESHVKLDTRTSRAIKSHQKKSTVFKRPNVRHSAQYEFYKRVEKAAKEKQRLLRKLSKPQYANVLYFGHKRPPKRHIASKMRHCSECGIRH